MSDLTILGPAASRAMRTLWMAGELGIEFEHKADIDFRGGDCRKPDFLAINRAGRVPAIKDSDIGMGESCAINIYLAKKHGKLIPTDLVGEARVLEWSFWVMTEVEKSMLNYLFHAAMLPDDQKDAKIAEQAVADLQWPLELLNTYLADHKWLVGDDFSVADLNVAAVLAWGKMAKFDFSAFPNVAEFTGRCLSRPAAKVR